MRDTTVERFICPLHEDATMKVWPDGHAHCDKCGLDIPADSDIAKGIRDGTRVRTDPGTTILILCEGELDALRLQQEFWEAHTTRIAAVSATNGAGQATAVLDLIRMMFPDVTTVGLALDQDEAGDRAAEAAMRAEAKRPLLRLRLRRLKWDRAKHGKDITDYLQSGGTVAALLDQLFAA